MGEGAGPRRRFLKTPSARVLSAAAAGLMLAAGVGAVVYVRPPWLQSALDHVQRKPAPSAVATVAPSNDPLGRLPQTLVELLVHPGPDAPTTFVRLTRVRPEAFCKHLEKWGLRDAQFQGGVEPFRGWTCVTALLKPIGGDDAMMSSLFVSVRGIEADRIDNIRMKLNLLEPAGAPLVKTVARDLLIQISRSLGWDPPEEVMDALEKLKEGRIWDRGVTYDLRKEFGDGPTRLNLIIIFPRLIGAGGEGRFITDPRRSAVAN